MAPKVSVIIPVYKVEAYINQCVDSVLIQSYHNLEIILVDDGSPDNCPEICDEYERQDMRIKVIHKKNGGLSDARNSGLEMATGEYVMFLDSDDYWDDTDAVKKLIEIVNNHPDADVVYFQRHKFIEDHRISNEIHNIAFINGMKKAEALKYLISNAYFMPSACNKLIRREILTENKIVFQKGIVCEDIDWNFALTLHAEHLYGINNNFYAYRTDREGSITNTIGHKNIDNLLWVIEKWAQKFRDEENEVNNLLLSYCTYQLSIAMGFIYNIDPAYRKDLYRRAKELQFLFKYKQNRKARKVSTLVSLLGFRGACLSFGLFIRAKITRYRWIKKLRNN